MGNSLKKDKKKIETSTVIEQNVSEVMPKKSIAEIMAENARQRTPEELAKEERELNIQQKRVDADTLALMAPVQDELEEKSKQLQNNELHHLFKPYQPREPQPTTGCFSFIFSLFCCKKPVSEERNEAKRSLLRN